MAIVKQPIARTSEEAPRALKAVSTLRNDMMAGSGLSQSCQFSKSKENFLPNEGSYGRLLGNDACEISAYIGRMLCACAILCARALLIALLSFSLGWDIWSEWQELGRLRVRLENVRSMGRLQVSKLGEAKRFLQFSTSLENSTGFANRMPVSQNAMKHSARSEISQEIEKSRTALDELAEGWPLFEGSDVDRFVEYSALSIRRLQKRIVLAIVLALSLGVAVAYFVRLVVLGLRAQRPKRIVRLQRIRTHLT